jgi:hypothetical protein
MQRTLGLLGAALLVTAASLSPAQAGDRGPNGRSLGKVTACSENGHYDCYTAPVRAGRYDNWMRLKGGTWVSCDGDCRGTLRKTTVDFWDTLRENGH